MRNIAAAAAVILIGAQALLAAPGNAPVPQSHEVPVVKAELGDCSVEIKVTDTALKPVYKATISTQLRYGFGGFHHLDLEVQTNLDGQARFASLSPKARMPLRFDVRYEDRLATVVVDLRDKCNAVERAVLPDKRPSAETPE
jgi:hypothetical protein